MSLSMNYLSMQLSILCFIKVKLGLKSLVIEGTSVTSFSSSWYVITFLDFMSFTIAASTKFALSLSNSPEAFYVAALSLNFGTIKQKIFWLGDVKVLLKYSFSSLEILSPLFSLKNTFVLTKLFIEAKKAGSSSGFISETNSDIFKG